MSIEVEVTGNEGLLEWAKRFDDQIDSWLTDLVNDTVNFAESRLRAHAPGKIKDLVTTDGPKFEVNMGWIQGFAGVLPDFNEDSLGDRGEKSNPADYPYFVDVGTGIYGETGTPITSLPGHVMGPILMGGRMVYTKSIKGQPAQHYSDAAFRDTDVYLPLRIQSDIHKLGTFE
jgi:hypothetical protein